MSLSLPIHANDERGKAMTSSTHSLHIYIGCSRNVLMKITEIQNVISSLFLYPVYITFSLFCSKYFTLSIDLT